MGLLLYLVAAAVAAVTGGDLVNGGAHNLLVRLPEEAPVPDPIVLPPPRQNNIVYVPNKQDEKAQQVIEGLLLTFALAASAALHGYNLGEPSSAGLVSGPGSAAGVVGAGGDVVNGGVTTGCQEGEVLHVDGTCVTPEVTRKVYVFDVPEQERPVGPAPSIPPPAVDHNILFVRLPEEAPAPDPIVLPPPRQNNIVYVLNKQEEQTQRVIEVPAQPQADPEIYFVNYQDGENPTLPLGVDLETALSSAAAAGGQVLGSVDDADGQAGAGFGGVGGITSGQGINGLVSVNGFGGASGVSDGFGVVNGFGGVNGASVGLAINGGAGGLQTGLGGRPSGLYTTP
ncbi:H/ACA ribonucleoprotein complex subunit GAR1-like [Penaeus monodon]|uniref:H/ACA ribonucleoprotein complex subunit GAR1-like n=1 Tax=Penaeus monodon TaxID=6687 RepID=UPI0018A7DB06|nr:H/ACA ribonucleoprotein complex subunit GAR1-like [Penaeus monodon]